MEVIIILLTIAYVIITGAVWYLFSQFKSVLITLKDVCSLNSELLTNEIEKKIALLITEEKYEEIPKYKKMLSDLQDYKKPK